MHRALNLASIAFFAAIAFGRAPGVHAAEAVRYHVDASLNGTPARLHVEATTTLRARDGEELAFWLYSARTQKAPRNIGDRSWRWIFVGNESLARFELQGVQIDGQTVTPTLDQSNLDLHGLRIHLRVPNSSGDGKQRKHTVAMRYEITVPERFGRFGQVGKFVSMTGPWYPLLISDAAFPGTAEHSVSIKSPGQMLVMDQLALSGDRVHARARYVPALIAPSLHRRAEIVDGHALTTYSAAPLKDFSDEVGSLRIPSRELLRGVFRRALRAARFFGLRPPDHSNIVITNSRTELAATAPGLVLISDRAFELFPIDDVQDFHRRAIMRALFRDWLLRGAKRKNESSLLADLRAVALLELEQARKNQHAKSPEELLNWASFNPAVDSLLHARQVPFVNEYFGVVDDADVFRSAPEFAFDPRSSGKRVFEMSRDALSKETFSKFRAALVHQEAGLPQIARSAGVPLSRVDEWINAGRTKVNYRLSDSRSEGGATTVTVQRLGDKRAEPVEVAVEDGDGKVHIREWAGAGNSGKVRFEGVSEASDVMIDPRGRLVQSSEIAGGHPRGDDATAHPWRPPLLRSFGLNLLLSENNFSGFVDFAMRRRFNLEEAFTFTASHSPAATGGAVRYVRGFGPKLHGNARAASVSAGLQFDRLSSGFAEENLSAYRPSVLLGVGSSSYRFFFDPREGYSLGAGARVGTSFLSNGDIRFSSNISARGSLGLSLDWRHMTLFVASAGVSINPSLAAEFQGLGGRFGLRSYATSEVLGRAKGYVVVEHRWTALTDLSWNIFHAVWVRELQLAGFAGVGGVLAPREGGTARGAAEVGAGIRIHFEYGGVQPSVLSLDWAFPLVRDPEGTGSDGMRGSSRPPVGFHLSFDQYL